MSFSFESLLEKLQGVQEPLKIGHQVLAYHTNLYTFINAPSSAIDPEQFQHLLTQLDLQIEFYHDDKNRDVLGALSQPVLVAIAKNYATLLSKSKIKLFDITNKFVTIFSDNKKASNLRNLSTVILCYIYESFGREVSSFIALIISTIMKQLKKEKTNLLNIAILFNSVIRNGGNFELNESIVSKYHKFLKSFTDIEILAVLYGCFGLISTYKPIDLITFKTVNLPFFQIGLSSHKKIRTETAKSLAESLISLNATSKEKFDVFVELYIDNHNPKQQIGVTQAIIHYHQLLYVKDTDHLNNNFVDIINDILSIYSHERVLNFKSNGQNRLIEHSQFILDSFLPLIGESIQKIALAELFKLLDNEPSSLETLVILQFSGSILEKLSSLSDHEIELYHIKLWKLSTSNDKDIRIFTIQVLKIFGSKFPTLLREILETSLNELINNSKQTSSEIIFNKSQGYALILANLIELANKDYVPEALVKQVWNFTSSIINQNLSLTSVNYQNLSISWISIIGVFTYDDSVLIEGYIEEFFKFWKIPDTMHLKSLRLLDYSLTAVLVLLKKSTPSKEMANAIIENLLRLRPKLNTVRDNITLQSLVRTIENRVFQIYLRLINFIKSDLNSSVLIQAIKVFSDLPNYEVAKNEKDLIFSERDDGFSNGLTSKFRGYLVDELTIKYDDSGIIEQKEYSIDTIIRPTGAIGLNRVKSWLTETTWIDSLENSATSPIWSSLLNDHFQPIFGDYSIKRKYSPPVLISTIDSAIEIFSKVFPSLSTKVQLSLLETLRTHLLSKSNSENTQKVLAINISIVIHGILTTSIHENLTFDHSVGTVLLETLRYLFRSQPSRYLLTLNSESIGILISKTPLIEQIPIFIKHIVDNDDADSRSFNALLLSSIYQYNASHFTQILEVLLKLSSDPHPYVHAWSLDALSTIIDKHLAINSITAVEILSVLESVYLNDQYGRFSSGSLPDLNADNDSNVVISKVLRSLVNSLGPGIKDLDSTYKQTINNLVTGLFFNTNDPIIQSEILKLIQEWSIFDKENFEIEKIVKILKFTIQNNFGKVIGSNLSLPIYESQNEIFPVTSSQKLLNISFDFLSQLVKTSDSKTFIEELEYLIWIGLENNPDSLILNNLVKEWIDSTYDISWFIKLEKLFGFSKIAFYAPIHKHYQDILNKYIHKKVEVDVKDEESQSIAKDTEQSSKGESTNWKFKIVILKFIKQILAYTLRDSKLHQQISSKISELIKISYASSTSSVGELRLLGIDLLGDIIEIYSDSKDPIYPEMSLLEQQQAQIISALIPLFHIDSTPLLASHAIKVVATFIGSNIVSVSRLSRVTKILVNSLDDLKNDEEELRINEVVITSEIGKRRVKLAILNAWAELMILAKDEEIDELVTEHLDLLLPLWISTLKEYELLKHGKGNTELFETCWINIVEVIGVITEKDQSSIVSLLNNDVLGFYYLVYSDCMFALLGSNSTTENKIRILKVLSKILKFKDLVELVFHDDIFHETVEILERLIITSTIDVKLILIDIITTIFTGFFENTKLVESLNSNVDKLFEIVRINLQPVIELIPIKEKGKFKDLDLLETQLLKKSFSSIITMISLLPDVIKSDLYACVLSILEDAYKAYPKLIPQLTPILKEVLVQLSNINDISTINNFYQSIKSSLSASNLNSLLTTSILLTSTQDHLRLDEQDIELFVKTIIRELSDPSMVAIVTQTIKSIIKLKTIGSQVILKHLIPHLIIKSINDEDPRIFIELVILVAKQYPSVDLYTIIIPSLLRIYQQNQSFGEYVHIRIISLVSLNPDYFKLVINNVLDDQQRKITEALVKFKEESSQQDEEKIKLKTFE